MERSGNRWVPAPVGLQPPRRPLRRPQKPSQQLEGTVGCERRDVSSQRGHSRTLAPWLRSPLGAPRPRGGSPHRQPPSRATSRLRWSGAALVPLGRAGQLLSACLLPSLCPATAGFASPAGSTAALSRKRPLQPSLAPRADPANIQPFPVAGQWEGGEMPLVVPAGHPLLFSTGQCHSWGSLLLCPLVRGHKVTSYLQSTP